MRIIKKWRSAPPQVPKGALRGAGIELQWDLDEVRGRLDGEMVWLRFAESALQVSGVVHLKSAPAWRIWDTKPEIERRLQIELRHQKGRLRLEAVVDAAALEGLPRVQGGAKVVARGQLEHLASQALASDAQLVHAVQTSSPVPLAGERKISFLNSKLTKRLFPVFAFFSSIGFVSALVLENPLLFYGSIALFVSNLFARTTLSALGDRITVRNGIGPFALARSGSRAKVKVLLRRTSGLKKSLDGSPRFDYWVFLDIGGKASELHFSGSEPLARSVADAVSSQLGLPLMEEGFAPKRLLPPRRIPGR